jgi:hypothetical protein
MFLKQYFLFLKLDRRLIFARDEKDTNIEKQNLKFNHLLENELAESRH